MWINVVGWIGVILGLITYVLNLYGILEEQGMPFLWLNIISSLLIIIYACHNHAYPSVISNVIWASVAAIELWQLRKIK